MNADMLNFLISDIGIQISLKFICTILLCIFLFFIILVIIMNER